MPSSLDSPSTDRAHGLAGRRLRVGATIHDAFVYTAAADSWQGVDAEMKQCMDMACQDVIGEQYVLKSDRHVVEHPERYRDEDGQAMWNKIETALAQAETPQEAVTL